MQTISSLMLINAVPNTLYASRIDDLCYNVLNNDESFKHYQRAWDLNFHILSKTYLLSKIKSSFGDNLWIIRFFLKQSR